MSRRSTIAQSADPVVRSTLDSASKHALIDLVIDLLRQREGDEHLDGEPLAQAFVTAFAPIARARGDRPAKVRKA